jgi:hypothetical protein
MEMLKEILSREVHILRTHLEFLEAYLTSDGKFAISACNMENLKIQPFDQTSIQEGGGLEAWMRQRLNPYQPCKKTYKE